MFSMEHFIQYNPNPTEAYWSLICLSTDHESLSSTVPAQLSHSQAEILRKIKKSDFGLETGKYYPAMFQLNTFPVYPGILVNLSIFTISFLQYKSDIVASIEGCIAHVSNWGGSMSKTFCLSMD